MVSTPAGPEVHANIRSTSGVVSTGIAAAAALFLLGDAVVRGGWPVALQFAPWVLLVVWVIHIAVSASAIRLDDNGATVQNMLRRHRLPWGAVTAVDVHYQLVFHIGSRKIPALGGPAAGRPGIARRSAGENAATRVPPLLRVQEQVQELWEHRRTSAAAQGPVRSSWDLPMIVVFVVLLAWGLIQLALG